MGTKILKLRRPSVALPTPFRNGAVDFAALERLCHRQIDYGTVANPIPVKRALHRLGLMVHALRPPLTPLGAMGDMKLASVLHAILPMEKEQQTVPVVPGRPRVRSRA